MIEGNNNSNSNNNNNRVDAFVHQQKQQQELKLKFGSLPIDAFAPEPEESSGGDSLLNLKFNNVSYNGYDRNLHLENPRPNPNLNSTGNVVLHGNHDVVEQERTGVGIGRGNNNYSYHHGVGNFRSVHSPEPSRRMGNWGSGTRRKGLEVNSGDLGVRNENLHTKKESVRMVPGERSSSRGNVARETGLPEQLDHPGLPSRIKLHSVAASDFKESRSKFRSNVIEDGVGDKFKGVDRLKMEGVTDSGGGSGGDEVDVIGEQLADSLLLEDESEDKNNSRQRRSTREKVNT